MGLNLLGLFEVVEIISDKIGESFLLIFLFEYIIIVELLVFFVEEYIEYFSVVGFFD